VCAVTLVHYERTVRLSWTGDEWAGMEEVDAASVYPEGVQVHWYTMSKQSGQG